MRYRALGQTGLTVSEIGFGCGLTAGLMVRGTPEERRAAVGRALELGITYFDTAPIYGGLQSEIHVGETLRDLAAKPIVATKVALEIEDLDNIPGAVYRSVEGSIRRLGLKWIEVLHLHNRIGRDRAPKPDIGVGALLTVEDVLGPSGVCEAFDALKDRGLVRHVGCCSFGGDMECLAEVIDSGRFESMLTHFSLLNQTAFTPGVPSGRGKDYRQIGSRAADRGMGIVALKVLDGGEALRQASAEEAIGFALARPEVSTVLVGFSEVAHVEAAAASTSGST
jgi:aryl-alcohol dehydrogenase-like predicted oxidoreductase